jgi:hypothetical protein
MSAEDGFHVDEKEFQHLRVRATARPRACAPVLLPALGDAHPHWSGGWVLCQSRASDEASALVTAQAEDVAGFPRVAWQACCGMLCFRCGFPRTSVGVCSFTANSGRA